MVKYVDESKIEKEYIGTINIFNADKGPEPLQKGAISPVNWLFTYKIDKVLGHDCPNKFLITIDNCIVCFVNSKRCRCFSKKIYSKKYIYYNKNNI